MTKLVVYEYEAECRHLFRRCCRYRRRDHTNHAQRSLTLYSTQGHANQTTEPRSTKAADETEVLPQMPVQSSFLNPSPTPGSPRRLVVGAVCTCVAVCLRKATAKGEKDKPRRCPGHRTTNNAHGHVHGVAVLDRAPDTLCSPAASRCRRPPAARRGRGRRTCWRRGGACAPQARLVGQGV